MRFHRNGVASWQAVATAAVIASAAALWGAGRDGGGAGPAAPVPLQPGAMIAATADTITPAMVALGRDIFQGKVAGGLCATCHGKDAKGVQGLGPNLTDATWLHGDGSMEFLTTLISTGVMKPKQGASIMPPYGGTPLKPDQLRAVAAYVHSLSHPLGG